MLCVLMADLRILSATFGVPDPHAAQWIRALGIAKGLKHEGNEVKLVNFMRRRCIDGFTYCLNELDPRLIPSLGVDGFYRSSKLLQEYKPDLIFANTHIPACMFALSAFRRTPLVFDMHGFVVDERKMLAEGRRLPWAYCQILTNLLTEYFAIKSSDKVLCVSHHMIHYLGQMKKVRHDKMEYVTNGVDLNLFKPLRGGEVFEIKRKLGLENKFVFGYMGGLETWQGVEKFVDAARFVKDKELGFLIVGGDDAYVSGNVVKLKKIPRNQVPYYYSACDVLVLPRPKHIATEVAAPTKFAEYAAMGKPVLVTNVGDPALFVKKYRCGIVIRDNNPTNLKEGFCAFKELSDRELRRMGKNSRKLAEEEFDLNKILAKLDFTLTKLVEIIPPP